MSVDLDWALQQVPAPPAQGSEFYREQMFAVLWVQRIRTPEQVQFIEQKLPLNRFVPIVAQELLEVDGALLSVVVEGLKFGDALITKVREAPAFRVALNEIGQAKACHS